MKKTNYIIYTWPFSADNGGVIFMHRLVHELNQMGESAFLWHAKPIYRRGLRGALRDWMQSKTMVTAPELNTPIAHRSDLTRHSIVVYPELVPGNPLKGENIVRWLLYKPGVLHPYKFGLNEVFFRVGEITDIPDVTGGALDLVLWKINHTYRNENRKDRSGVCYIVRKGQSKPRIQETEVPEAIQIDGLSHDRINEIFNRCDIFYSYDEATMYSQYAAIAGCKSVVIPGMFASRKEWVQKHPIARYGVAYGIDDLDYAVSTMDLVHGLLLTEEQRSIATVKRFVEVTRKKFST